MEHCSLGVACPPFWAVSMHPRLVCKECLVRDYEDVKKGVREQEKWQEERWGMVEGAVRRQREDGERLQRREELRRKLEKVKRKVVRRKRDLEGLQVAIREEEEKALRLQQKIGEKPSIWECEATPLAEPPAAGKLTAERVSRTQDILSVFPLTRCKHQNHRGITVCGSLCVPISSTAEDLQAFSEPHLSAALGLLVFAVRLLSEVLDVPLPFATHEAGSRTTISARCSADTKHSSWWTSIFEAVTHLAPYASPNGGCSLADPDSTTTHFPLWVSDHTDLKHRQAFLQGVNALNVNMLTLLHAYRVKVTPHRPPTDLLRLHSVPCAFTLTDCLSRLLHNDIPSAIVPLGYPTWRGCHSMSSPTPATIPSGCYIGTLMSSNGANSHLTAHLSFTSEGTVTGKVCVGTAESFRLGNPQSEVLSGAHEGSAFGIGADGASSNFTLLGKGVSDGALFGKWQRPNTAKQEDFCLKLIPVKYLEVSPQYLLEGPVGSSPVEEAPLSPGSPTTQEQGKVINQSALKNTNLSYFGKKAQGEMPRIASDGSEGWEIVDI